MALIEISDLVRSFIVGDQTVHALDGVSLQITAGEFVAITGPSGSGKTTLMHLLGLLDRQNSGRYALDGRCTDDLLDDERAQLRNQQLGFIFQNFYLLPRATALRNVQMPLVYASSYVRALSRETVREMACAALERVGLADRMHHRPNELSGGQRQRVAIARALVNKPSVIFADEPTGNLDSATGHEILALFSDLNREGVTIVLVTHDPAIAALAQRRVALLDGRIVEDHHVVR